MEQKKPPYVWAVVIVFFFTVLAIFSLIILQPDKDHTQAIITIVGMFTPTIASIIAVMKASDTHILVNSRMTEFKDTLEELSASKSATSRAEGIAQGWKDASK